MGSRLSSDSTAEEVKAGIEQLGTNYVKYGHLAADEGIDGSMLGDITEEELAEWGVTSSFHKKKILKEIVIFVESGKKQQRTRRLLSAGSRKPSGRKNSRAQSLMHITYSREDSELLVAIQDAAGKAKYKISGVMTNQGEEWFAAWLTNLKKAKGVCVFFTEGNARKLNNQDVGYKDMLVNVKMYKDLEGKDFHIAELQVHLAGMIEAKSNKAKGGHLMYRVIRQQQEVIDGKGTTSRFGAQHKHFDTDADWSELTPIEEIPGKADKAAIQAFLPDAEVDKIVADATGKADKISAAAEKQAEKVVAEAQKKAAALNKAAEGKANGLGKEAEKLEKKAEQLRK